MAFEQISDSLQFTPFTQNNDLNLNDDLNNLLDSTINSIESEKNFLILYTKACDIYYKIKTISNFDLSEYDFPSIISTMMKNLEKVQTLLSNSKVQLTLVEIQNYISELLDAARMLVVGINNESTTKIQLDTGIRKFSEFEQLIHKNHTYEKKCTQNGGAEIQQPETQQPEQHQAEPQLQELDLMRSKSEASTRSGSSSDQSHNSTPRSSLKPKSENEIVIDYDTLFQQEKLYIYGNNIYTNNNYNKYKSINTIKPPLLFI